MCQVKKGPKFTGLSVTNMRICCFYVFTITVNCMSLGVQWVFMPKKQPCVKQKGRLHWWGHFVLGTSETFKYDPGSLSIKKKIKRKVLYMRKDFGFNFWVDDLSNPKVICAGAANVLTDLPHLNERGGANVYKLQLLVRQSNLSDDITMGSFICDGHFLFTTFWHFIDWTMNQFIVKIGRLIDNENNPYLQPLSQWWDTCEQDMWIQNRHCSLLLSVRIYQPAVFKFRHTGRPPALSASHHLYCAT